MRNWPRFKEEEQLRGFYADSYMRRFLSSTFDNAFSGRVNTWDSQWYFTCLSNNGLSIIPARNMISNIGTVGAHAGGYSANNFFPLFPCDVNSLVHPEVVYPNQEYDRTFFEEQFKVRPASVARSMNAFLRKRIRRMLPGTVS
jgi:hypothetical protein